MLRRGLGGWFDRGVEERGGGGDVEGWMNEEISSFVFLSFFCSFVCAFLFCLESPVWGMKE